MLAGIGLLRLHRITGIVCDPWYIHRMVSHGAARVLTFAAHPMTVLAWVLARPSGAVPVANARVLCYDTRVMATPAAENKRSLRIALACLLHQSIIAVRGPTLITGILTLAPIMHLLQSASRRQQALSLMTHESAKIVTCVARHAQRSPAPIGMRCSRYRRLVRDQRSRAPVSWSRLTHGTSVVWGRPHHVANPPHLWG